MKGISFKTILKSLLPVVVTGLFAVFFFMTRSRFETGLPEISHEDGFADLRDYDFDDQVYNLVNNWDYYPGELLLRRTLRIRIPHRFRRLHTPILWMLSWEPTGSVFLPNLIHGFHYAAFPWIMRPEFL